jgi:hypothetical protein
MRWTLAGLIRRDIGTRLRTLRAVVSERGWEDFDRLPLPPELSRKARKLITPFLEGTALGLRGRTLLIVMLAGYVSILGPPLLLLIVASSILTRDPWGFGLALFCSWMMLFALPLFHRFRWADMTVRSVITIQGTMTAVLLSAALAVIAHPLRWATINVVLIGLGLGSAAGFMYWLVGTRLDSAQLRRVRRRAFDALISWRIVLSMKELDKLHNLDATAGQQERARLVARLESLAQEFEAGLAMSLDVGDASTMQWFEKMGKKMAASIRNLKRGIVLPGPDDQAVARHHLIDLLDAVANNDWSRVPTAEPDVVPLR